ncbi:hypothetical protein CHELA17_40170 [Chelatococcus asaccharovorans]|nr:hypothetical protein CHELA17_40170 [Chelatococcus asaccharovorans]
MAGSNRSYSWDGDNRPATVTMVTGITTAMTQSKSVCSGLAPPIIRRANS